MTTAARIVVSVAALSVAAFFVIGCTSDEPPVKPSGNADKDGGGAAGPRTVSPRSSAAVNKELTVRKLEAGVGNSIIIDGNLNEAAWSSAAMAGPFVDVGSGRENPELWPKGTVKLLWDDAFLYAGFRVEDKTIRGGYPTDAKDPHLWERDTVEMMTDPDGDGDNKDYYEIQINPQNLVFDTQYDDYNFPNGNGRGPFGHEEWSAGLTSAVVIDGTIDDDSDVDRGYTVEAKIPWSSFTKAKKAPPAPGDVWRMNFYAMQNNGGTAWSPILGTGNFHRASRFGRVHWVLSDGSTGAATDAGTDAATDAGTDAGASTGTGTAKAPGTATVSPKTPSPSKAAPLVNGR